MKNKKLLSLVLAIAMLVSMFSVGLGSISASAAEGAPYSAFYSIYGNFLDISDRRNIVTNDFLVGIINEIVQKDKDNGTNVVNEIEEIEITMCPELTDISILFSTFPNVRVYDSYGCPIESIEGVSKWSKLENFDLADGNNLLDITEIFACQELTFLSFDFCEVTSIEGISNCTKLTEVSFTLNKITDISELYLLENLKRMSLSHNNISDITGLKEFCESSGVISSVRLENNPLADHNDYLSQLEKSSKINLTYIPYSNLPSDGVTSDIFPYVEDADSITFDNDNKVITINSVLGATSINFKRLTTDRVYKYIVPENEQVYLDGQYRYNVYKPDDTDRYTTTITVNADSSNPIEYTLIVIFNSWPPFKSELVDLRQAVSSSYDSETSVYTINSESKYVRIYKSLSDGRILRLSGKYDFITEHTNFYQVNKAALSSNTAEFVLRVIDSPSIKTIVNFLEKAFDADELTVKNATEISFDAENSALTIDSEGTYVRVYKVLTNGATVKVNADDYDFITEHDNFYHINKLALKASDLNTASFEMTTGNGDVINTAVNFIAKAPEFEASKLTIKNATNTSFDAEKSALTIDSEGTYVRVYKTLANGTSVKVNADDYDFITEYDNFYHINKLALKTSDLNIAAFEMTTDSGDTISTKVNFPNAGILPLEKFKITNYDSLTIDGNVINIDIIDTKTYSRIFKTVSDGTTLTIESDSVYVEEREDCYVLRQRAVGATITMTYGENTYTINLTK